MHTAEHEKTLKLWVIKTVKHELIGTKMLLTFYFSKLPGHTVLHYLNKLYVFVPLFLITYLEWSSVYSFCAEM